MKFRFGLIRNMIVCCTVLLLLSGCSRDASDGAFPAGKYPLELRVAGLKVVTEETSRSIADNNSHCNRDEAWSNGCRHYTCSYRSIDSGDSPRCCITGKISRSKAFYSKIREVGGKYLISVSKHGNGSKWHLSFSCRQAPNAVF